MEQEILERAVRACVSRGKPVAMVPNGKNTAVARKIMEKEFAIEPAYLVDNAGGQDHAGVPVCTPEELPDAAGSCTFLVTTSYRSLQNRLIAALRERFPTCDVVIARKYTQCQLDVLNDAQKVKIDFLGIGFPKCLTSSIYTALLGNPNIYLGTVKETYFLVGLFGPDDHAAYKAMYPEEATRGKICGGIETQYVYDAQAVHDYYGSDIDLLVFMRDPVKALFSYFKMDCRLLMHEETAEIFKRHGKVTPEMFMEWAHVFRRDFAYGLVLRSFLEYFPAGRIHAFICEEMLRDPQSQMDDLQRAIGLAPGKRRTYDEIPFVNVGSTVSRDYLYALANKAQWDARSQLTDPDEIVRWEMEVIPDIQRETCITCPFGITPRMREELLVLYREDINAVEQFIGRSLEGLWY